MNIKKRLENLLNGRTPKKKVVKYKPVIEEEPKPKPYKPKVLLDDIYGCVDMYGMPRDKSGMY